MSAQVFRLGNPITDMLHLAVATLTGLDDGISEATGNPGDRPFGTNPVESTFGVGGKVLPTTMVPVAPSSAPAQPAALAARVASSPEMDAVQAGGNPPNSDPPKADDHVSDAAVKTDATEPVPPQADAPKPNPKENAAQPDAGSGTGATDGDNPPTKAKHGKTGLHLVTGRDRHATARTEARSATDSQTAAPVTTGPRHRIKHGKDTKSVGGQPDSAPAAAGSSTDSHE